MSDYGLTKGEKAVLELLAQGMSNKEIAEEICRTVRAVDFHMENIRKKLNAVGKNRVRVLLLAKEKGWV